VSSNGDAREQLGVIGEDLRSLGRQVRRSVSNRAAEVGASFDEVVRESPVRSVLIAAGVGALAGMLLWRR